MSINAARTELNLTVVGDDQTAELLEKAAKRVESLEGRIKGLTKATQAHTRAAAASQKSIDGLNAKLTGLGKTGERMVDGFDKMKNSLGKVVGAFGFWGAAIAGSVAAIGELVSGLGDFESAAERSTRQTMELVSSMASVNTSTAEMVRGLGVLGQSFRSVTAHQQALTAAQIQYAEATGDEDAVERLRQKRRREDATFSAETAAAEVEAIGKKIKKIEEEERVRSVAQEKLLDKERALAREVEGSEKVRKVIQRRARHELEIVRVNLNVSERLTDQLRQSKVELQGQLEAAKGIEAALSGVSDRAGDIVFEPMEVTREKPSASAAAGKAVDRVSEAVEAAEAEIRGIMGELELDTMRALDDANMEREFAREQKAAAAKMLADAEAVLDAGRSELAQPILDFTSALQDLGPELDIIERHMGKLSDVWQSFVDKNASLEDALMGSARAVAGAVAEQIGGAQALAAVEAAYHVAKGIGTAFTNPAESIGHFAAAAGLAAVAAGAIGGGGGKSGSSKSTPAAAPERREERESAPSEINYNFQSGVMDGQSVAAALRQAERASRGTGFTREMGS